MDARIGHQSSGLLVGWLLHSYRALYDIVCSSSPHVFSHKALQTVTAVQSQWKSILKKYATAVERLNYSGEDIRRYWRGRMEIFVVLIIVRKTVIWPWAVIILGGLKFQNGDDKLCQISERFYGFLLATRDRGDFWQLLKILKFEYPYYVDMGIIAFSLITRGVPGIRCNYF